MSQLKIPVGRLAALLAALLAAVLAVAGCGRSTASDPAAPATTVAPAAPAAPQPGRIRLGDASAYVAVATTDLAAHAKPGGGRVVGLFPQTTPWGSPTPFLVTQAYRDAAGDTWLKVLLPRRPNGSVGWIRREQVRLHPVDVVFHDLQVDRDDGGIQVADGGHVYASLCAGSRGPRASRGIERFRAATTSTPCATRASSGLVAPEWTLIGQSCAALGCVGPREATQRQAPRALWNCRSGWIVLRLTRAPRGWYMSVAPSGRATP